MDEESGSSDSLNGHPDEYPKNGLEARAAADHEVSRHNLVKENIDARLSFTCKSDSLALLSVYMYARNIKSFLGWENEVDEFELEESNENSPSENGCNRKESCSSNDETSGERLNGEEIFHVHNGQDSTYLDEISGQVSEGISESVNDLNDDSELSDSSVRITPHGKIFRSEVKIFVEDWRKNSTALPLLKIVNTENSINGVMDEPLAQQVEAPTAGININNMSDILKDESPYYEIKTPNDTSEIVRIGENILNNFDGCNTSKENNAEEDERKENESNNTIINEDIPNKNLHGMALDTNLKQKDERKVETDGSMVNSESLRNSLVDSVDKLVGYKENTITSKSDKTLKAHIQYENEITKQPVSKEAVCNGNINPNRKENEDTECGFSIFRPRWLQPFATAKVYVVLYSFIGVLHGSYYSYLIGTLSTLEKRYTFKSKISGAIMVADEITPLLLGVIIGYYAGKANRPRMIALGMLLSAGCCFCSSVPYFIYGPVLHTTVENMQTHVGPKFCDRNLEKGSCELEGRPPNLPAVLSLVIGSFLKGFGNLAYYAIGLAYLDDNSNKKTTPIYLAIALALRLLGPLVGFLMSSAFLKLYENPAVDPGYGPDDPRWVGAWWIGFFLQGVLLVIFTLPIALFPRRLPGQKVLEMKNTAVENSDGFKQLFRGLVSALKRLGSNPVFILLIVNTNMKIFGHFGHSIMLPKYVENQFRLSASEASLYSGATSITFVMLSTILGGYLIWKFRPRIKVLLAGMIISETILCVGYLILIIPRCQSIDMVHFGLNDDGLILNSACNQNCDCSTTSYTPFCGPGGTTYFSPCYAGCTEEIISSMPSNNHKEYRNCSCVSNPVEQNFIDTISEGVCPDEKCWSQAVAYLIFYFFLLSISNAFTVAHSMILLRSVHPGDKSIALGTFETFICLFGFIPFPVTFGALVDSACLVWENTCGDTGNCWFYDMEKYSYLLHGFSALFCSFSVMCLIGLYFLSSRVRDLYADEEKEEKDYVDIKLDTVSGSETTL